MRVESMTHPNPNFSVNSYHHHHHLMYPSLHLHHHHVHFMFRNTFHITTTNQKQRYAGVVSFSLSNNSQRQIKPKPARDRVIDFGKYKGNMLGTLPSKYLKWVSKNLRAGEFLDWAKLADEVLADPVYKDRIEWEFAFNLLSGDKASSVSVVARSGSVAVELQEISERFGWDNDDKVGWSKVDFNRLGTSYGGRIPRLVNRRNSSDADADVKAKTNQKPSTGTSSSVSGSGRSKRMERRERQKTRLRSGAHEETEQEQEKEDMVADNIEEVENDDSVVGSPFPGRQALLRKAIDRRKIP